MHSKCSEICSVMSNSLPPHGLYGPRNFPGQNIGVRYFPSPGDLLNPGIEPRSPTLQADSLPTKPQGKPKNTGVGCHCLLQEIFSKCLKEFSCEAIWSWAFVFWEIFDHRFNLSTCNWVVHNFYFFLVQSWKIELF